MRWRGPVTTVNYRPVLSSDRADHTNKPVNIWWLLKKERKIGHGSQMGEWHQDRLADWQSVGIWLWLRPQTAEEQQNSWSAVPVVIYMCGNFHSGYKFRWVGHLTTLLVSQFLSGYTTGGLSSAAQLHRASIETTQRQMIGLINGKAYGRKWLPPNRGTVLQFVWRDWENKEKSQ
jgi:hypothetical protein